MTIETSSLTRADDSTRGCESAGGSALARFESAPAAPAQARLWLLHQLDPSGLIFHICGVIELAGPLDDAALELALHDAVARHEPLRTTLHLRDGVLEQQIALDRAIELSRVELDPRLGTADPTYQSVL